MTSSSDDGTDRLPTREQILAFIAESDRPVGKREIARAFNITGGARIALKRILRELKEDGTLKRAGPRRVAEPGVLPSVLVVDVVSIDDETGEAEARPAVWDDDERGPPPPIVVLREGGLRPRDEAAPGFGDRLLVRLHRGDADAYEARVIRRLETRSRRVTGAIRSIDYGWRLIPADRRAKTDYSIEEADLGGAEDGEFVVAETLPGRRLGLPRARVVKRLGQEQTAPAIIDLAIEAHGIPDHFPAAAVREAEAATAPKLSAGREDLRSIPFVTIDGEDARDFDDAVHAEPDPDPTNPDGHIIRVAIADVAHYVTAGSALDRSAEERGNSVYFPDRVVPMLPEALSNGLCSLRPHEDRYCLAAMMRIDGQGTLLEHRFVRGLMRSAARLTYNRVQAAHEGRPDAEIEPLMAPVIRPLYAAFQVLDAARRRRGALEIDMPERRVVMDETGRVTDIRTRQRFDAHKLIEEFMILANVAAADTLLRRNRPCLFRVHDQPPADKVSVLRDYVKSLGLSFTNSVHVDPRDFNRLLKAVANTPLEHQVNTTVLRSQSQATYSPDNIGHFGLSLERYAHFTSPIRRYADLIVHRSLIKALNLGSDGLDGAAADGLHALGEHLSITERRADLAEREVTNRLLVVFLADRVGATFGGRITGVHGVGLFIELDETGADGFVPISTLGREFFILDPSEQALIGERSGMRFTLGDRVEVRLREADIVAGGLLFELIEGGRAGKPPTPGQVKRLKAIAREVAAERARNRRDGGGGRGPKTGRNQNGRHGGSRRR
ncbi:MAG: ribonuclease R [Tistrella sp.]|nr:ribonuclease R [Tistrella sp.]